MNYTDELHIDAFAAHRLVRYAMNTTYVMKRQHYNALFHDRCESIIKQLMQVLAK